MLRRLIPALLLAGLLLNPGPARADQIDGDWCAADGRHLSIQGPKIVTPGGNKLTGDYDRHGFAYVVPAGEPGAGGTVLMAQQDDNTMHLWRRAASGSAPGAAEVWHRCTPRTS